jgi:hypothetical protein
MTLGSSGEPSGLQKPGKDRSGTACPSAALEPLALALLTKQVDRLSVEIDCPDALLTLGGAVYLHFGQKVLNLG